MEILRKLEQAIDIIDALIELNPTKDHSVHLKSVKHTIEEAGIEIAYLAEDAEGDE